MRLIIHGGIHRTGTTALQRFFSDNRDFFKSRGILYPGEGANHQRLAWDLFTRKLGGEALAAEFEAAVQSATPVARGVLISAEDFCIHEDLSWLKPIQKRFDVEVIFYLRRQDIWLMSWYNQHVKWPFDKRKAKMSAEEFLQTIDDYHWLDFYSLAERWSSALGREKVTLRVFEGGGDVVLGFCRAVGIDTSGAHAPRVDNTSLPAEILPFVRHFNIFSLAPGERTRFISAIRKVCEERNFKGGSVYPPALRNLILARFAESNRRTAHDYFGRPDGRLFAEESVAPDAPYASTELPESDELMAEYVVPLVRALVTANRKK